MAACDVEISSLPLITGCPSPNEWIFVGGAMGGEGNGLYGRRKWKEIFGVGMLQLSGDVFDSEGIYLNSGLVNSLFVFHNGISRFLVYNTEWDYVKNVDNEVVGIQITGAIVGEEDVIFILPNASICDNSPTG